MDAVTLEVLRNAAAAVAEEMNATLVRTAYSPNVTDRLDCSCALFDAEGAMVAQAENIPVHLGAMPHSVAAAIEAFPPETLDPGDAILLNDPFHGGAHLPDLTIVSPIFYRDSMEADPALVGFAANRAHHADVGGSRAGSVAADSTEIYQEGLRIPPVKLVEAGEPNQAVLDLLLANVRTPEERRGDLGAQRAANATAGRRVGELIERHGAATYREATAEIQDYAERRMRSAISDLPEGEYRFEDALDDDGRGNEDLAIAAAVAVEGESIVVDFEGTAATTEGPLNAPIAVTTSATYYAIRCLTDPEIPPNAGCYRPVEVRAPAGTIVNAGPPAAVVGGNLEVSQRVVDVVLGAMAEAAPERAVAAGQGTMNNLTLGGTDPRDGEPYAFYETQAGGFGGRAAGDGMDAVHVHMSNTRNTPAEVLETAYPFRVLRYALRPDSGGAGEFRGGLGLRRDVQVRGKAACSLLGDRRRHRPYGIEGGEPGAPGQDWLLRVDGDDAAAEAGEARRLAAKTTLELEPGDAISIRTPGGGGYGDPADRDPEAIARDLRQGKLTPEAAWERYGVEPDESRMDDAGRL